MSITEDQVRNIFAGLPSGEAEKFFEHVSDHVNWTRVKARIRWPATQRRLAHVGLTVERSDCRGQHLRLKKTRAVC